MMFDINTLLNGDKAAQNQSFFGMFGQDAKGNNEIGRWARLAGQPTGYTALLQALYQNQLEPGRQAANNAYIQSLLPENIYSQAEAARSRLTSSDAGLQSANQLRNMGAGAGAQYGAVLADQNARTEAGNNLLTRLFSPEGRTQAYQGLAGAYNQTPNLSNLLNLGQFIEGRSAQNAADKAKGGLGGFIGSLGQIAGSLGSMGLRTPIDPILNYGNQAAKLFSGGMRI